MLTALLGASAAIFFEAVPLQSLDLRTVDQDWGSPQIGKSADGNPIRIGGKTFNTGVGVHANVDVPIQLGGRGLSFTAFVGVDDEVQDRGSVVFSVVGDGRALFTSPVLRGSDPAVPVEVNLKGIKVLQLIVTDAGDGISYDHANWADALITMEDGAPAPSVVVTPIQSLAIAPVDLHRTRINYPRIVGGTNGRELLFRIPASGKRPLRFACRNLPAGVSLDADSGILRGSFPSKRVVIEVSVSGPGGRDQAEITMDPSGTLALTPPMGWNSWNVWGLSVDANKVRDAANAFVNSRLADFGYAYVNIDDGWEAGRAPNGEILTNEKFPDMAALAQEVHQLGLKIGIYSSPGRVTCGNYTGSLGHEAQDAATYAKWGMDYLKYDWCSYGEIAKKDFFGFQEPYLKMRTALDLAGRDIVYSLCQYGMGDVWTWGHRVGGNAWRTTGDITDSWSSMAGIGFPQIEHASYGKPGGWNDPDMLVVGRLGWGPSIRPTRLKPNEQITHMTLWCMLAAPLLIGCDLTQLDAFTQSILMNPEVLAVNQDPLGAPARRHHETPSQAVWTRKLADGSTVIAFFNKEKEPQTLTINFPKGKVRDLWQRRDLGAQSSLTRQVPYHGALMFKVS